MDKARQQGVPAYVILHDRSLRLLASQRPKDQAALATISGLGTAKREHYGGELLEIMAQFAG
jgi:ATP-dependent DNA helicase RecQ